MNVILNGLRRAALLLAMGAALASQAQSISPLAGFARIPQTAPTPLLKQGQPVQWWFAFKLNAKAFPECGGPDRACPFGGTAQDYQFGQQFVYASSESASLQKGSGCGGDTLDDPIGATFGEIYNGDLYYVVWNDQFYSDPLIDGWDDSCLGPRGHSKGVIAWNDAGEGVVMQVITPSWPAAGSKRNPRKHDGNTLGYVTDDNVKVSQHFFALRLSRDDTVAVLQALQNASIVTDPTNPQLVRNRGPAGIQTVVSAMGVKSTSKIVLTTMLSSGVGLISMPSALKVPPWQLVSSVLGGAPLRTASWWANPRIPTTKVGDAVKCWAEGLREPGPVEVATSGSWKGASFSLRGGPGPNLNHAKIGVSTSGTYSFSIFGDLNQQGSISGPNCASSQNGRGGLFFVMENRQLNESIANLIAGDTAPASGQ